MRMMCRVFFLIALIFPVYTYATKPCKPLSKTRFIDEVVKQSDLVALVSIQEMSPDFNIKWTKVAIKEPILNTKEEKANVITINKWRALDEPLFFYKVGDSLVVWLRKAGNAYELTNNNWNHCEPALWDANENKIKPAFNDETNSINTIAAIKQLITENRP